MIASHWQFWAILSAAFAAATAIFSKIGLRGVDPNVAQFVRTTVIFVAVGSLSAYTGRWRDLDSFAATTWVFLILSGIATAFSWLCYFQALAIGNASRVAAVDKLSVPLVSIIAVLALKESMSIQGWIGVVLSTVGVALISLSK